MFVCLLAQTPVWASPAGASVVLGGNCLFSLAHLGTCGSTPRHREMLKAMGRQCWESQALPQQFPGEDPLSLWGLLPWVGASSGLGPGCAWCWKDSELSLSPQMGQVSQPIPWDSCLLCGDSVGDVQPLVGHSCGPCKHQQIEIARYRCLERLQMLGKCSRAPLGRSHGVLSALRP